MTTPTGAAADERERLIEAMRIAEALGGVCPDSGILYKVSDMLRADAETITEMQHASGVANQLITDLHTQLAAQSAELERVRKAWTDEECSEFLAVAFRHVSLVGTVVFNEMRQGISAVDRLRDKALAAPSAAGGEKEG